MKHVISAIAVTATLLTLGACSPTVVTRGNLLSDTKLAEVEPSQSTRDDVNRIWGPPTTVSTFDDNTWYYIGETTSQKGIFAPELVTRRMIRVTFNDANTVTAIDELDPADARNIHMVKRTTPNAGKEFTVVQQMIGNIGKYNTKTK